jgi:uncharacterized protein (TIGR00661 family)
MRILYGVHTQGQGGLAKASVLIPRMEALGHEVRVVSSGVTPPSCYRFNWHRHVSGMEYVVADGRTDSLGTFNKWVREAPLVYASLQTVRSICDQFQPELVISDFEPLTGTGILKPKCEVVAASRPMALIDPQLELPEELALSRKLARTVIRLFSSGADRRLGYHLDGCTHRCLPPVTSDEVAALRPVCGDSLLVYNVFHTQEGSPHDLIRWAARRKQYVKAYGFPQFRTGKYGYVTFHRPDRSAFLRDLAACKAVVCTAGVNLPIEAHLLGKPCAVVPIPNQWEQRVNAFHLDSLGIARAMDSWDYDAVLEQADERILRPVSEWLLKGADEVIARLLNQPVAACTTPSQIRIAA